MFPRTSAGWAFHQNRKEHPGIIEALSGVYGTLQMNNKLRQPYVESINVG